MDSVYNESLVTLVILVTIVTSGVRAPRDSGAAKAARLESRFYMYIQLEPAPPLRGFAA